MIRLLVILAVVLPTIARASNPSLEEAHKAILEVRYDEARELLVQALKQGANPPEIVAEIYRLSAATAAVLGPVDLAEQYYRRMLALAPDLTLPPDASPRLREPFVAAQAYMAAQQRFTARVVRSDAGIEVSIVDPLRMVVAVATLERGELANKAPFAGAPVTLPDRGSHVVLLDEHGNFLRMEPLPQRDAVAAAPQTAHTPILKRWITWAIPAAVFTGGSVFFFVDARLARQRHDDILANDQMHFFAEAESERRRWQRSTIGGYVSTALAVGFATTAIVLATRRPAAVSVTPSASPDSAGVLLEAKF